MKCSTTTLQTSQQLLVQDFQDQFKEGTEFNALELEQSLRSMLQEIGKASLGEMLSLADEHQHPGRVACACRTLARRISRRSAKLLSVFGWVDYRPGVL
jgi:hypothetical protein